MKTKLNIVIPLSGKGSRFEKAGYSFPKPLIDIKGECMISLVTKNLIPEDKDIDYKFIYICLEEHFKKYDLENVLRNASNNKCEILAIDRVTEGAACTVLLASESIDNDTPLLIANSDQYIEKISLKLWYFVISNECMDGGLLCFNCNTAKQHNGGECPHKTNEVG